MSPHTPRGDKIPKNKNTYYDMEKKREAKSMKGLKRIAAFIYFVSEVL